MSFNTTKKIIAACLTVAMAMSPVFMTPTSASDGQDVESSASSWRYQDGDIVAEEDLNPFEADAADYDLEEDFCSQMGSGMKEETEAEPDAAQPQEAQPAEAMPEADSEQPDEIVSDGQSFAAPVKEQAAAPDEQAAQEGQEDAAAPEEEPPEEPLGEGDMLTAQEPVQDMEQAPEEVQQAPETVSSGEGESSVMLMSATVRNRYWTWSKGKYKRGPGYLKGIDVSYWQGKINWKKVKAAGVDFAIIRCGYGSNKSSQDDSKFAANVKGCIANGIPYGVYLYAHANTVSEAKNEANHAIRMLKANKCKPDYPVYYDLEDRDVAKASNATIRKMAKAFCSKLRNEGYPSGVYANLNWWNNKLSGFSGYDKWVAQWAKKCDYKKTYSIWQCTSSTTVSGISGRVDANLLMCPKADIDKYMNKPVIKYKFKTIDGKVYLVSSTGKIVKDKYFKHGAYRYVFDKNGVMRTDGRYRVGYKYYRVDKNGRAYLYIAKAKEKSPYYEKPGKYKKGNLKKGKHFYVLRPSESGKWVQMANGYWIKKSKIKKTFIYPSVAPSKKVKYKAKLTKKTRSRSGPSNNYLEKKIFKKDKTVTVIGTYGNWSRLSTGQWLPSKRLKKK